MKNEIKAVTAGDIEVLQRNGKVLFCPFKPTIIIPAQIAGGQSAMHREPCGSWCPHFNKAGEQIYITCKSTNV